MGNYLSYFLSAILLFGVISCEKEKKKAEAEKVIKEWIGKEYCPTDRYRCTYLGDDTVCSDNNTPYKVLVYTDSTGCTDCKLQLYKWDAFIKEAREEMTGKVSFHFYFQPKDEKELIFLLKQNNFSQAVYMDTENKLNATNKLPVNVSYQCFRKDKDNKVLLIGNPTLNPKIWDLYKQTISGEENAEQKNVIHTTVEAGETEIELKDTKVQETSIATFTLKNTGNAPLG